MSEQQTITTPRVRIALREDDEPITGLASGDVCDVVGRKSGDDDTNILLVHRPGTPLTDIHEVPEAKTVPMQRPRRLPDRLGAIIRASGWAGGALGQEFERTTLMYLGDNLWVMPEGWTVSTGFDGAYDRFDEDWTEMVEVPRRVVELLRADLEEGQLPELIQGVTELVGGVEERPI